MAATVPVRLARRVIGAAVLAGALAWTPAALAVPAAPVDVELTQPDGTTFVARQFGDEWYSGFETRAGYTILRDPATGAWAYAVQTARGRLVPGDREVRREAPPAVETHLRDAVADDRPASVATRAEPNTGVQRTLVILVDFLDQRTLGSRPEEWSARFFGATDSVRHYYDEVSYGKLAIAPAFEGHGAADDGVVGWLTLASNHPNTGRNTGSANKRLTRDAIAAADPHVDFSRYDANGNGAISRDELHVVVIAAGREAAFRGEKCTPAASLWGHRWAINPDFQLTVDDKAIGDSARGGGYSQFGEIQCDHMATIGIMVHELGHDLGLPDLYDETETSGTSFGAGFWSVMAGGSWLAVPGSALGSTPSHPDAFSKWYEGWLEPRQWRGTNGGTAIAQAETTPTAVQLLDNPNAVDWTFQSVTGLGEYFLVENRQRVGYDRALPGCGLLIWHLDETRSQWTPTDVPARKLVDLEQADGLNDLDARKNQGDAGDPWLGALSFDAESKPSSHLYDGSASGVATANMGACGPTMTADLVAPRAGPENDDFSAAAQLSGTNVTRDADSNVGAGKEAGEPDHADNRGGASVWYAWRAPASGSVTIDTAGSGFDTLLGVYRGGAVDALTPVGSDDDGGPNRTSRVSFTVAAGTTYRIAVDGYNSGTGAETGDVDLHVVHVAQSNDDFAAALELTGSDVARGPDDTTAATKEAGEPDHAGNAGGASVWYRWTAPASGSVTIDTVDSDFDTLLAVYTGDAVGGLTRVEANDDHGGGTTSSVTFPATAGTAYRIAVDGFNGGGGPARGTLTLHVTAAAAAALGRKPR